MSHAVRWQQLSGPTGGAAELKHSGGPWTRASATAAEIRTSAETSRSVLGRGHEGIAAGGAGLSAVAALAGLRESWEERLTAVRDECEALRGTLLTVAKEMGETDTAVGNSFAGRR
ncbi:hypothetical protein [Streptomyces roseoviridis]|uniref:Amino acid ABC transporter permease n=1 Tax=Streptomyces roseoviridis TaxID=67361 RepID=A0ABV5QR26_9ACTN